jgi:type III secretion protein D
MELELRILVGLHRGACTPVAPGDELLLGGGDDCDVVLVDPGWSERPVSLRVSEGGWVLGERSAELMYGNTAEHLGLRFTVCDVKAPWSFDAVTEPALEDEAGSSLEEPFADELPVPPTDVEASEAPEAPSAAAAGTATPLASQPKPAPWLRWVLSGSGVAVAALAAFSLASAYAPPRQKPAQPLLQAAAPAATAPARPSQEELKTRFTQRLREAELLAQLELELEGEAWLVKGNLGPDEAQRLERVIVGFIQQQRPGVGIQTRILAAEELLPFRIREIRGGSAAAIVTDDGRRLYVGDSASGYTLARVESNRVIFTGKRRIEVPW